MSTSRRVITVVGAQAEGEVGDVITGGVLPPPGATMMEKKLAFERQFDHIRRLLIQEPRGSVARHVNLIVPSTRSDCVAGAIFMEPTEYPPMSGSNTMCIATVLLETGIVPMQEPLTRFALDMPAGKVEITAECRGGKCLSVSIENVPAMALALDTAIDVVGVGRITIDVAYGGMIFAIVDAAGLGFKLEPGEARALADLGERIRIAARQQIAVAHPELPEVPLYEELVTDPHARAMLRFVSYPVATSRAFAVAPGVPADRLAALRAMFMDVMRDPDLQAAARKRNMEIGPVGHAEVEGVMKELFATPALIVEEMRRIVGDGAQP